MPTRSKLLSLVLAALLAFAFTPALAQFSPTIFAVDQDVVDGVVNVTRVTSDGPGWVVIHADDAGAPGDVIGYVAVPNGISANVKVQVEDAAALTPVIYAMLHEDGGAEGTFEFPDGDPPVEVDGTIAMAPINVTATGESLAAVVANQAELSTLFEAIEAAGMAGEFAADSGPYTVFAPSNDAFAALPEGELDALLADPEALGNVLTYHLLPGVVTSDLITESIEAETINGAPVSIEVADGAVTVNGANVTTADLTAYNGVVHIIDAVLLPPAAEEEAAAEAPAEEATPEPVDLVDTAVAAGGFDTLVAAVQAAGLENALRSGTYTVFAPTDEAFAALPAGTVEALLEDPAALKSVIYNHMVGGVRGSDVFTDGLELLTPRGQTLTISAADGGYMVNDANIVASDVAAFNGVIHAIDKVLVPANVELPGAAAEAATEEAAAAEATPEPTEEATEEAAAEATAEATPEPTEEAAAEATAEPTEEAAAAPAELPATGAAKQETGDLVDTAAGVGNLNLVLQAVQAVGLEDTLRGEGPYTVFAVSDSAFGMIPPGMIESLSPSLKEQLGAIIRYHIVPGRYTSADLSDGMTLETLEGDALTITTADGGVQVNGAPVVAADIEATNGVIHVIGAVLMPPGVGPGAAAAAAPAEAAAAAEATAEPTEEAVEEVAAAEATAEATEEATAEATAEPTEEAVAEATAEPTEEAVAAEATAEPTEEAVEEAAAAEATPEPTEEAAAEAAMTEAAPAGESAAEATAAPVEEAPAEEAAPEALPATGGSTSGSTTTFAAVIAILVVLAGAAFVTRRRQA